MQSNEVKLNNNKKKHRLPVQKNKTFWNFIIYLPSDTVCHVSACKQHTVQEM